MQNALQNYRPTSLEIPALLREITSVIAVIVDDLGNVLDANRGFLYLANRQDMPRGKWNIRHLFLQPIFAEFSRSYREQQDGTRYQGMLNIGEEQTSCRSVCGIVMHKDKNLLIMGEYDMQDLERLTATVIELNDELAQAQRYVVNANRALKRNEKKIVQMMLTDPMTGVANRRAFDQRIAEELSRHQRHDLPCCLVMGDIDHFKKVNDNYGHDVGDIVICAFAHVMRDHKRAQDFVARVGGEEFMMVLPQTKSEDAVLVMDRIRERFVANTYAGIEAPISASFGIASLRENDTIETLVKRTDQGLYAAKEGGRNKVVWQA
jgi:diguanylate cyclase (GGDEF)-like protein